MLVNCCFPFENSKYKQ
jgi:hypothetical protein